MSASKRSYQDTNTPRKRKSLTLEMKLNILQEFDSGLKACEIVHKYGMQHSTVTTILKQRDKIMDAVENDHPLTSYIIRKRYGLVADMEIVLRAWCEEQINNNKVPLDKVTICYKAKQIYDLLKKNSGEENRDFNFSASNGWFTRFKKRSLQHYGVSETQTDENTICDPLKSVSFVELLKKVIDENGFTEQTVFYVRETSLFWKRMPKKSDNIDSLPSEDENDRLSLILGSNADGSYKLKPVVVYHTENPKSLKNKSKAGLPVIWKSNMVGKITASLFEDWFGYHFMPEVERYCKAQNLVFKVLLLLDNAAYHPPATLEDFDSHVKVVFIPPENTNILQPISQSITKIFKTYYTRNFLGFLNDHMNQCDELPFEEFWHALNILDAVRIIGETWSDVDKTVLKGSWKNICPSFADSFKNDDSEIDDVLNEIVYLTKRIGIEMTHEDITNFLENYDNEDIEKLGHRVGEDEECEEDVKNMTAEKLLEAVKSIENGIKIFEDIDSNEERVINVKHEIYKSIECYLKILNEKRKSNIITDPTLNQPSTSDK